MGQPAPSFNPFVEFLLQICHLSPAIWKAMNICLLERRARAGRRSFQNFWKLVLQEKQESVSLVFYERMHKNLREKRGLILLFIYVQRFILRIIF